MGNPKLTLRPLQASDLTDEVAFAATPREVIEGWLKLQEDGHLVFLVACLDGLPVGRGGIDYGSHAHEDAVHLWSLRVAESCRGRGIGGVLIDALEAQAAADGLTAVRLEVEADNLAARRLYERHGYHVDAETEGSQNYIDSTGELHELAERCLVMRKALPAQAVASSR